jgi:hypothetical protein
VLVPQYPSRAQPTTTHLFPSSSSNFAGFLAAPDPKTGLALTAGASFLSETTLEVLNSGFLCVICDGSTFFNPEVTAPPLLRAASRAAPPAGAAVDGVADLEAAVEGPVGMEEGADAPCHVNACRK